jgi:hypothetical protein
MPFDNQLATDSVEKTCDTVVMGHSVAEAIEFGNCTHTHRTHDQFTMMHVIPYIDRYSENLEELVRKLSTQKESSFIMS